MTYDTTPAPIGADAERAAFERWLAANQPSGCVSDIERGWQARAALASAAQAAAPEPNPEGYIVIINEGASHHTQERDMNIHECQRRAEREGFDKATFDLVNPAEAKRARCRWVDAYFGVFKVEGQKVVCYASQLDGMPLVCENFSAEATK